MRVVCVCVFACALVHLSPCISRTMRLLLGSRQTASTRDSIIRRFNTHTQTHTHARWSVSLHVIHPLSPPPEHSLHHLLFSFNKTPLHYTITSKTISSSFIFFSSAPPPPSYLIVPPARPRPPRWENFVIHLAFGNLFFPFVISLLPPPLLWLLSFSAASFVQNSLPLFIFFSTGSNWRKMICLT